MFKDTPYFNDFRAIIDDTPFTLTVHGDKATITTTTPIFELDYDFTFRISNIVYTEYDLLHIYHAFKPDFEYRVLLDESDNMDRDARDTLLTELKMIRRIIGDIHLETVKLIDRMTAE